MSAWPCPRCRLMMTGSVWCPHCAYQLPQPNVNSPSSTADTGELVAVKRKPGVGIAFTGSLMRAVEVFAGLGEGVNDARARQLVIGELADAIRWPFPTWAVKARPFDHERDMYD